MLDFLPTDVFEPGYITSQTFSYFARSARYTHVFAAHPCSSTFCSWPRFCYIVIITYISLKPNLHDTTGCQTGLITGWATGCIV